MASLPKQWLTPEQYLEIERLAETRSEYVSGEMFAMAGNTKEHIRIAVNLVRELSSAVKGTECEALNGDMRVRVTELAYLYPDITVVCGEPEFLDTGLDTLVNPTVIIEVLSKSTEAFDRGEKFRLYRSLASLQQYVLVSTDHAHIEWYTRNPEGTWNLAEADGLEANLPVTPAGCVMRLAEIYDRVEFAAGSVVG